MIDKSNKKILIIFICFILLLGILLFLGIKTRPKEFNKGQNIIDSLNNKVISLQNNLNIKNNNIIELNKRDSINIGVIDSLNNIKSHIKENTEREINKHDWNNKDTLVLFYLNRYPYKDKDTIYIEKKILIYAAKDLIGCDGLKKEKEITDTVNIILNKRINIKDSIIANYVIKDSIYEDILKVKDKRYEILDNINKANIKHNTQEKIKSYSIIGSLSLYSLFLTFKVFTK